MQRSGSSGSTIQYWLFRQSGRQSVAINSPNRLCIGCTQHINRVNKLVCCIQFLLLYTRLNCTGTIFHLCESIKFLSLRAKSVISRQIKTTCFSKHIQSNVIEFRRCGGNLNFVQSYSLHHLTLSTRSTEQKCISYTKTIESGTLSQAEHHIITISIWFSVEATTNERLC